MISSVVPEFVGGGVRKSRGNSASFWLLDSLLASSTHPVVFDDGLGVWTAFVLFPQKLVILKSIRRDF